MQQEKYLKTIMFITIFTTFLSGAKAAERQELSVEDMLYKGRLELTDNNPTAALEYFKKALDKCEPGSPQYNGRYGRCNFFVGEAYFQRFEMGKNVSDAKAAIKYLETVIDFGKKTSQDYPSLAKGRIRQIQRALSAADTGVSSETDRTFKVKTASKGKIVANSWNLYVNGERIDNPFIELFFVEDRSNDTPEKLRKAVYISDAGAAEVARRLGIQRLTQKGYSYDRYLSRTFRKAGYTDIVLKNGERFNGQWAIIEYDLNMPALPVKLFEHFGATVQADWSERKVVINAKTDSPATKDWFELVEALRLPPSGAGGDWIIGFHDFSLPEKISSSQLLQGRVDLRIKDNARSSAGAVLHISLFGDWSPSTELAHIYKGRVGEPRLISLPFSFTAPSKPGTYRLRCPMVLAFSPVKNYYGSKPAGQHDPGVGPYTEVSFVVGKAARTSKQAEEAKESGECACSRDSSGTWHCTFNHLETLRRFAGQEKYSSYLYISRDFSKCFWDDMDRVQNELQNNCYVIAFNCRVGPGRITGYDWRGGEAKTAKTIGPSCIQLVYPGSSWERTMNNPVARNKPFIRDIQFIKIRDGLTFTQHYGAFHCTFVVEKADIDTFRTNEKATDLIIKFSIKK